MTIVAVGARVLASLPSIRLTQSLPDAEPSTTQIAIAGLGYGAIGFALESKTMLPWGTALRQSTLAPTAVPCRSAMTHTTESIPHHSQHHAHRTQPARGAATYYMCARKCRREAVLEVRGSLLAQQYVL